MKSILILEDNEELARMLQNICTEMNTLCKITHCLSDAYSLLETYRPDLIILDRLLPDGDGVELAQYIHEAFFPVRILCISSLGQVSHRIQGLESGIDDYIPKPFSIKELQLRIQKLLQSEKVLDNTSVKLGPVRYFPESGTIVYERTVVQLRRKEALILSCLCRHRNQVISKDRIINYVWQGESEQPARSTLDVYVRRIRSKLNQHASLIQTTRGFGYSVQIK